MNKSFSIQSALSYGWETFKGHWKFLVPLFILLGIAQVLIEFIGGIFDSGILASLVSLVIYVVYALLAVGVVNILLHFIYNKASTWTSFNEETRNHAWAVFTEYAHLWWKFILAGLLYMLIVFGGFILLIIPGIYFAITYQYWPYIIIQNPEMGIWQTFKKSARITKNVKWKLLLAGIVFGLVQLLGLLALVVGIIVAYPIALLAGASVYKTLKDQTSEDAVESENSDSTQEELESEVTHVLAEDGDVNTIDIEADSDEAVIVNE
ncbi:MAG: DUF975 family protein [Candidatus Pacebacteria bacterium]|nr:DUF975 family protein [Candidatus Paceibacterota bacterium]MCD8508248.1 DUF975 family protein [Candidatus Paceibacterota bacterium]MCD8527723.1 DUF975 family protein [Candidatus Paceibacterota bacterium]MCD8563474.1 DUF975 family protein [Candidatus Paceibacterota bacterium]